MTTITYAPGAPNLAGFGATRDFSIGVTQEPTVVDGNAGPPVTVADVIYTPITGSGVVSNFKVAVTSPILAPDTPVTTSLTPDTCTVDSSGYVSYVDDGLCRIQVAGTAGTRVYFQVMSTTAGTIQVFTGFIPGSLAAHIQAQMAGLLLGRVHGVAAQQRFSTYDGTHTAPAVTRNASAFCAGLDLTGVTVMTGTDNDQFPWMLISPRHLIGAAHIAPGVAPYIFQDAGGNYHSATVLAGQTLANDVFVSYLSEPITGCTPFQILPANWASYLPSLGTAVAFGSMTINGSSGENLPNIFLPLLIKTDTPAPDRTWGDGWSVASLGNAADPMFAPFVTSPIGGDSSGPCFAVINGQPVLLSAFHTGSGGPWYAFYADSINACMNSLAASQGDHTPYALGTVSVAGFPTF